MDRRSWVTIEWYQRWGNDVYNPLLKILEKKINASERANSEKISNIVWETYFEEKINGIEIRRFLLNYSWYKSRYIIRMVTFSQDYCEKNLKKFTKRYLIELYNNIQIESGMKYKKRYHWNIQQSI